MLVILLSLNNVYIDIYKIYNSILKLSKIDKDWYIIYN
jgi:hypothetical protein